jgi:hypothetical protein
MFLRFSTINIRPIRLIKPLNFWVGDSPERMEICLTELGVNERQLLYFLCGQRSLISSIQAADVLIFTISTL